MGVAFAIEEPWDGQFVEGFDHFLEAVKGIAFCHAPEVLAVFVGEAVEDEGCEFVHALAVGILWVGFEEDVDDSGEAVVVVGFLSV